MSRLSRVFGSLQLLPLVMAGTLLLSGSAAAAGRGHDSSDPVVRTTDGALRGIQAGSAEAFLGVPFAAPPVTELRFAPPAPVAAWRGVRDAGRQSPACLQFQPGGVRETQATSEDCLYLDVYRPRRTSRSADLPVIVWVHGGGFTQGTGSSTAARRSPH